ncbi:hypothetical protein ACFU5O_32260 [Streptomyces sp. NPDC057445]|uniref:hypothetical protein n=1 Tax=Streptomyces sp. NPDC057445 TaxID=3346136 RepID=UPI0036BEB978
MPEIDQTARPGLRRVAGRIGRCVVTYVLIHATAWVIITAVVPWEDSFAQIMRLAFGMLLVVGIPTLLLAICTGLAHNHMDVTRFRIVLGTLMVVFTWPLLAASTAEPLAFQVMTQIAFAWLVPAPLIPENWVGRP